MKKAYIRGVQRVRIPLSEELVAAEAELADLLWQQSVRNPHIEKEEQDIYQAKITTMEMYLANLRKKIEKQ